MSKTPIPQYQIPLELLDAFQIQWQAYKSLQEYTEFMKDRPELAVLGKDPTFAQAIFCWGNCLGRISPQVL